MNFVLRIINKASQKQLFIDEDLKLYSGDEAISLVKQQKLKNVSLAKRNGKPHLRSNPNTKASDNISHKSISHTELISLHKDYSKAISFQKIRKYDDIRRGQSKESFIVIRDEKGDFISTKTTNDAKSLIIKHKSIILKAAKEQNIDAVLLGAILIDEYCRRGWDDWLDWLGALNIKDTSIGLAQIKLSTAREILKKGYYSPAPGRITAQSSSAQIWFYLNQPGHSIQFAAAAVRLAITFWKKKKIDISKRPRALAYLYSYGYTKNIKGATGKRCLQISTEFYQMAKPILL